MNILHIRSKNVRTKKSLQNKVYGIFDRDGKPIEIKTQDKSYFAQELSLLELSRAINVLYESHPMDGINFQPHYVHDDEVNSLLVLCRQINKSRLGENVNFSTEEFRSLNEEIQERGFIVKNNSK